MALADFHHRNTINCSACGSSIYEYEKCTECEKRERLKDIICPCCKSINISEGGIFNDNGIYGPGYHSWNTFPHLVCLDCGIIFKNLKINKKG